MVIGAPRPRLCATAFTDLPTPDTTTQATQHTGGLSLTKRWDLWLNIPNPTYSGVGKSVDAVAQSRGRGAPTTKTLNLNISGSKKDRDPI